MGSRRQRVPRTGELTDRQMRDREVRMEMGVNYQALARTAPWRRRLLSFLYHPTTELMLFALILLSIGLLVAEVTTVETASAGWIGMFMGRSKGLYFWADVIITLCFVIEYLLKLLVAPRKRYFIRQNIIDLFALLPIMRIFRLGRAVRLFRLLRMLRIIRVGSVLEAQLDRVAAERQKYRLENTIIGVYLFFSLVFGTVGIMVFESGTNEGFDSLGKALWWCVVTLTTVGYGDLYPITPGGKMVAAVIMFIGLSFFALLTSSISSVLIARARYNQGNEMEIAAMEHHVVICGWNESGFRLLQDLIQQPDSPHVVVLTSDDDISQLKHSHVFYVFKDPTTAAGLAAARVKHADVVVILADHRAGTPQDIDARTILTVLAVEQLRPAIHTIAELQLEDNRFHAENACADEVIIAGEFTGAMLSQAIHSPGMTDVFADLFDAGAGSIIQNLLPGDLVGQRFSSASAVLMAEGEGILLGMMRGGEAMLSPMADPLIAADDRLILLSRVDDHGVLSPPSVA
ncbi:MAG: ion transporter [Myxococcota bacterium]|nr:ion transporter [Myxococcota bacterium]